MATHDEAGGRATREGRPLTPLPEARARLTLDRTYTAAEFARLAGGFIPDGPDDRWFIYLDGDWLAFHRNWTGHCLYRVRLARDGAGYRIAEAWANRDPAQYRRADDRADGEELLRLIEVLLLGRPFLVPE